MKETIIVLQGTSYHITFIVSPFRITSVINFLNLKVYLLIVDNLFSINGVALLIVNIRKRQ